MGWRQPNSLIDAATLATAEAGIFRAFRAKGITLSIGHAETRNSFIKPPQLKLFRILSESALCAGLTNRTYLNSTPTRSICLCRCFGAPFRDGLQSVGRPKTFP